MTDNVIIIPSRLEAKRLPNKPLKKINNKEMILHVYEVAKKANVGDVIVASPNKEIYDLISSVNGTCIITKPTHKTGTDRIFEVFDKILNKKPQLIINLQGDMPNLDPKEIIFLCNHLKKGLCDIATLAAPLKEDEVNDRNVVKVFTKETMKKSSFTVAADFNRDITANRNDFAYHHIGIYGFTNNVLIKYVNLKRSKLELERDLEQMRALENRMNIHVGLVNSTPLSVDTEKDLKDIQELMK